MNITLILGDCIEKIKEIPDRSVDCIVTSPPYWKGFEYEAYFNSYKQYLDWCKIWLKECKRVLKKDGTVYLNVINDSEITIRAFEILEIATKEVMFKLHDTIIWYRYNPQPSNSNRQLTNQCEYIFMLRHTSNGVNLNKKAAYEYNPDIFKTRNVGNVWEMPFNRGEKISFSKKETKAKWGHSGFPLDLPITCILLSTKEDDVILDPFIGSGTTGVACLKLNRKFIGIELEEKYYNLAADRCKEYQSKLL